MLLEKVIENLKEIKGVKSDELENEITVALKDYEVERGIEAIVIIDSSNCINKFKDKKEDSEYISEDNSPTITIKIEEDEKGLFSIIDAWEGYQIA